MRTPHTPAPWFYKWGTIWADKQASIGIAQRVTQSAIPPYQRDNNLKHATKCVNAHGELCGALRAARDTLNAVLLARTVKGDAPLSAQLISTLDTINSAIHERRKRK